MFEYNINCYLELKGMHRFGKDMRFGEILRRIRNGEVRDEDIQTLNSRVFEPDDLLPEDLRYATFYNKDRDAINAALFEKRCKKAMQMTGSTRNSVLIFSDEINVQVQKRKYDKWRNYHHFWRYCSESHIEPSQYQPRMDPVLRLYEGCPVMLPDNICVSLGQANGTRAIFEKIVLKGGETSKTITYEGMPVQAVKAGQIDYVVVRHERGDIQPARFRVKPKINTFNAKVLLPEISRISEDQRESLRMQALQVPLLINNATTGHKLQGATVNRIFVHSWRYEKNWPYVVLSRVTTLEGLYLRTPLESGKLEGFAMPNGLKHFTRRMEANRPDYFTPDQYEELLHLGKVR